MVMLQNPQHLGQMAWHYGESYSCLALGEMERKKQEADRCATLFLSDYAGVSLKCSI